MRTAVALLGVGGVVASPPMSPATFKFMMLRESQHASQDPTCPMDFYNCSASDCSKCFNAGGRPGVMCNGPSPQAGYLCPPDIGQGGTGVTTAFACMDWTFGSTAMQTAEASFHTRTGQDVYFGVGTYGTDADAQKGLGACYRMKVEGLDKDIIAQSINTGSDVWGNQFDLQVGAGGAGAFNTCAGSGGSMYPGSTDAWGDQYGGVRSRDACDGLPEFPQEPGPMQQAGDSLRALCKYSFDKAVRHDCTGQTDCESNPTLLDVARVQCPDELVELTQIQRTDEPSGYVAHLGSPRAPAFPNLNRTNGVCHAKDPGAGTAYCLTRMMDCRKPSGAWTNNVKVELTVPGRRVVQTCTYDGYTRIDVQCGCQHCWC